MPRDPARRAKPKTDFLQIRLTPDDRILVDQAARAEHLDTSTWARQVILKAAEAQRRKRER
jgi:uncharacterized protein (DUF1778 family)